jgi:hypothetical protein
MPRMFREGLPLFRLSPSIRSGAPPPLNTDETSLGFCTKTYTSITKMQSSSSKVNGVHRTSPADELEDVSTHDYSRADAHLAPSSCSTAHYTLHTLSGPTIYTCLDQ